MLISNSKRVKRPSLFANFPLAATKDLIVQTVLAVSLLRCATVNLLNNSSLQEYCFYVWRLRYSLLNCAMAN